MAETSVVERPKQRCSRQTKAGRPCRAWALHGEKTCLAHADEKTRDSNGFGGAQERAGRPRVPRITELLLQRAETEAEKISGVLFEALEASRGVTIRIGRGEDALVETPDHATRLAAVREIYDRVDGKPRQMIEGMEPTTLIDATIINYLSGLDTGDREALVRVGVVVNGHGAERPQLPKKASGEN